MTNRQDTVARFIKNSPKSQGDTNEGEGSRTCPSGARGLAKTGPRASVSLAKSAAASSRRPPSVLLARRVATALLVGLGLPVLGVAEVGEKAAKISGAGEQTDLRLV